VAQLCEAGRWCGRPEAERVDTGHQDSPPHPAILLVSAYLVERGLILEPYQVDSKTNEIKALPEFIKHLAVKGVVFAFDAISPQKNLSPDSSFKDPSKISV